MEGLPIYWGDLSHHQDNFGDATQETLPPMDGNVQMTLWIPFHSTQTSVAPVLFQRANTAPVQYSADPTMHLYDPSYETNGHVWATPPSLLQRSLSDPAWSCEAEVQAQAQSQPSPEQEDEQPKKLLRKERRRSQNRKAQRAFRERKESRLRELEEELASVNAKYDALENENRHITRQLLALMAEREDLLGSVSPPGDAGSPVSPRTVLGSRRTSVANRGTEDLTNDTRREEEVEPGSDRPKKVPSDASP